MQTNELLPLMRLGGWMTISNVIGPIMVYLDRFLIGSLLSVASVAYYATPYELVTKLWIVPGSVVSVLFPAFAYLLSRDKIHVTLILGRAVKYVFFALFPFTILIMAFAHEGLDIWLGSEFANNSSHVLRWLALGVFINSIAQVPFALIQGIGRPDLTSKLHLVEFPFYLLTLWFLINAFGIVGAAIAWVARVAVDAILLFIVTNKILEPHSPVVRRTVLIAGGTLLALVFNVIPNTFTVKICYLLLILVLTPSAWFFILNADERLFLRDLLNASLSSLRRKTW